MQHSQIQSYQDLKVWQQAMDLVVLRYHLTRGFPREEIYGLTTQIRSSVSVPANIAEGHGRDTRREFIQFLRIAQGSLKELETHLLLSARIGLATAKSIEPILQNSAGVGKMLRALIRSLEAKVR